MMATTNQACEENIDFKAALKSSTTCITTTSRRLSGVHDVFLSFRIECGSAYICLSLKALKVDVALRVEVTNACASEKVKQRILRHLYLLNPSVPRQLTDEETKRAQSEHLCSVLNGLAAGLDSVASLEVWFKKTKDGSNRGLWKFSKEKMVELGLKSLAEEVERKWDDFDLRSSSEYQNKQRTEKKTSKIVFVTHRWEVCKAALTKKKWQGESGADGGGGSTGGGK